MAAMTLTVSPAFTESSIITTIPTGPLKSLTLAFPVKSIPRLLIVTVISYFTS